MSEEGKTQPLQIGYVEEGNTYLAGLGSVGDEVTVELWKKVN
jgi:hypothetical protein